jgi:hypothetical protein
LSRLRWRGNQEAMSEHYAAAKKLRESRKGKRTAAPRASVDADDKLLTAAQAAAMLGCPVAAVHEMRRMNILPFASRVRFQFYFSRKALEKFQARNSEAA